MKQLASKLNFRGSEATLTLAVLAGFVALTTTSSGGLSAPSMHGFFTYLCVPVLIGSSQMTVMAVGQLNLGDRRHRWCGDRDRPG